VFIYCNAAPKRNAQPRATVYSEPRSGSWLYRSIGVNIVGTDHIEIFLFAGHTHRRCEGCEGWIIATKGRCPFCNHERIPA
jgi:hypothetical protein